MAEIWLARQSGLSGFEKLVVIKRMVEVEEESTEMFLTEARLAAQLTHPHVVQIYELGEHAGSLYIVMEYLDGEDLAVIRRTAQKHKIALPDRYLARIVSMAAEGLHYAHTLVGHDGKTLRIVHRDVSPQNLIATFDGGLKVVDFGIAKQLTHATNSGKLKGKLGYMSPEQARGEPLDARSDVYALGIVLFEAITGRRLLPKLGDAELLDTMAGDAPWPHATERRGDTPPGLDAILHKAMQRRREDRFQSAREFHEALEEWLRQTGKGVSSGELADFLRNLFAARIHDRRQLIEQATSAELTPALGQHLSKLVSQESSSSRSRTRATQSHSRGLVASVIAMAVVVLAIGGAVARKAMAGSREADKPSVATPAVINPPAKRVGSLVVDSVPSGAVLFIDGSERGPGPISIDELALGRHEVLAKKDGFQPTTRTFTLETAGEKLRVEIALLPNVPEPVTVVEPKPVEQPKIEPEPVKPEPVATPEPKRRVPAKKAKKAAGKLSLKTTPWTTVYLGSRKLGDTPLVDLALPVGTHTLKLVGSDGSLQTTVEVEILANETTVKKLKF